MKKLQRRVSTFLIVVLSFVFLIAPAASISVAASTAADAEVFPYTQGTKYQASTNYTLKANGVAVPVIRAYNDYDYAHFSASEGLITYELTILNTDKVHEYSISPKKLGITASKVEGRTITFSTDKPEYLIIMMNNRTTRMVIAADPAELDKPESAGAGIFNVTEAPYHVANDGAVSGATERTAALQLAINDASAYGTAQGNGEQGVVYVPAGQYYIGNLLLRSNSALYLEPGAVLIGTGKADDYIRHWYKDSKLQPVTWWISTEYDSENIKIYGRGTLDGNGSALSGDRSSSTHTRGMINNLVVPISTQNFKMDGIIVRESSAWAVTPVRSNDLVFTNLKIFNSLGMSENDGIDINESQNVHVKNVIGIALDDPFSTKAWAAHTDIASGDFPWPGNPEPVDNVLFEDLIAWTLCYGYKVGQGVEQNQNNITFRNGVVYRAAVGFGIHHKWGSATISNVTFENMDVEQIRGKNDDNSSWMTLHSVYNSTGVGPITDVTVKNITVREKGETFGKIKGHETAWITDVAFENVYMPDSNSPTGVSITPATRLFDMNFLLLEYYDGVTILPVQNREPRVDGNLALNKSAFISANDPINTDTAGLAFDGKMNTRAGTARTDAQWIYVDLGAKQTINEVRLYWETAYGASYQLRVSDDAVNWQTVYNTTTGKGGTEIIALDEVEARYVQMFGIKRGTKYGYSLWEFEVYLQDYTSYDVVLDKISLTLKAGEQDQLTATVLPENTIDKSVRWSSSDNLVATVDEYGLVTAITQGSAVITATTNDTGLDAHAIVTVLPPDDMTPPTGSFMVNSGDKYTNATEALLSIEAQDDISGVHQMRFRTDQSEWMDWENYVTSKTFSLPSGDGIKTIYMQFNDQAGNVSEIIQQEITLDTTAPVITFTGRQDEYSVDSTIAISCTAYDELSGIQSEECPQLEALAYSLQLGVHKLSASATDNAGNATMAEIEFSITLDYDSLSRLTESFVTKEGIAHSLTVKLLSAKEKAEQGNLNARDGMLGAYVNQVSAQSGKSLTEQQANLLISFVEHL